VKNEPYVSVAFVNRNDGYGGDLEARIEKFIEYYAFYVSRWPGLFEFVICDWNPPEDRPRLSDAFPWHELRDVTHVVVPPESHARVAGTRGRKMLDYIGRNVAIRRGRGIFSLVLNQDIFISQSILELIAQRNLSPAHFYRADRCDFDFAPCRNVPADRFENAALDAVFFVHRRHRSGDEPISIPATKATLDRIGSGIERGDRFEAGTGIIFCDGASQARQRDLRRARQIWNWLPWRREWRDSYYQNRYYQRFYLHTNAGGDFILAPRKAFFDVHGMFETTAFYMHLDAYAIMQLFAAGYEPAVFAQPHRVYHADHDRSGRADFKEEITFEEHEVEFSKILRDERSYRLNDSDWGLANLPLPMRHIESSGINTTTRLAEQTNSR
jgi:hypothetical protein